MVPAAQRLTAPWIFRLFNAVELPACSDVFGQTRTALRDESFSILWRA